jgi:hypothetical protein
MSGGIAFISAATEAVNVVNALEFGSTGGVILGDFVFSGFEVPAQISFSLSQAMTVHKLVGGERKIDLMGPDDGDISWSGTFINSTGVNLISAGLDRGDYDPQRRSLLLEQMAAAGRPLPLQWGNFYYTVFIRNVSFDTRYEHVPYRISCIVLRNEATVPLIDAHNYDIHSVTANDLNNALASAPASAKPAIQAALDQFLLPGPSTVLL